MNEKAPEIDKDDLRIDGKRIYLRSVKVSDATEEYLHWLNSEEINQFLESRFLNFTINDIKEYIKKMADDENIIFLAIIRKDINKHIGNIKLGPIHWNHRLGDIGIMIGDKTSWGKGYASEAIGLLTNFAFNTLNLHKVTAGAYKNNIGSGKAFQNAGFYEEGVRKKHFSHKGRYIDVVLMAKISNKKKRNL